MLFLIKIHYLIIVILLVTNTSMAYENTIDYSELGSNLNRYLVDKNSDSEINSFSNNIHQFKNKLQKKATYLKAKVIFIDTSDSGNCNKIKSDFQQKFINQNLDVVLKNVCEYDPRKPFVTITQFNPTTIDSDEFKKEIELNKLVNPDDNLINDTRNILYGSMGMAGLIFMLPESVSKWDKSKLGNGGVIKQYKENITEGPVTDQDDWAINYIGHPISGAAYYMVARHANLGILSSFGYSVIMSTFFWEYGVEAFAEIPSKQDLWITPIIGSIFGELFFHWEKKIAENDNKVLGSKKLGKFFLLVFNPAGKLSESINHIFDKKIIQQAQTNIVTGKKKFTGKNGIPFESFYYGLEFNFRFNEPIQ